VLTGLLEKTALAKLTTHPGVHKSTIQRLASAGSKNAGAWLNAVPTSPELTLYDAEYIYAVRHRLGLKPHDNLPPLCACGNSLEDDSAHFHSCQLLKRSVITARHDRIVKLLAHVLRVSGAFVQIEYCPSGVDRKRPDLTVVLPEQALFIDVVVCHPSAPSRISLDPLASARRAEAAKQSKYADVAQAHGARILGFALETYGAFGECATDVLQIIRRAIRTQADPSDRLDVVLPQQLAVALQKGNALVARMGALRARQAARLL